MTAFIIENMAPIMFVSLILFLILGYPVAFALSAVGLGFAFLSIELGLFGENFLRALPDRVYGTMSNETLLAIPFFTFMGLVLQRSGMAEDLIDTVGQLFGPVRGGLAYAVVFVGALLAATTGVVAASVISMSLIALPIMLRYGYDRYLATGVIMASGTLAQTIPPSIILIVLADQFGQSVGDVYKGALVPALLLVVLYAAYVFGLTMLKPDAAPPIPKEARRLNEADGTVGPKSLAAMLIFIALAIFGFIRLLQALFPGLPEMDTVIYGAALGTIAGYVVALANRNLKLGLLSRMAEAVVIVLVPPLALIFLVLGTIFLGVATPTEGGAMGAAGALIMAIGRRRLSFGMLSEAIDATARLSTFVMFILIGSRVFALTFYGVNGHEWVEHLLLSLPGGVVGFLIIVNLVVFLLGFFLDFFEIAFILVPLLAPAAQALGVDLVWFAVMLAVNLQTSYLTPPFGFALFFMRSATPSKAYTDTVTRRRIEGIRTIDLYRATLAFIVLQLVMIGLLVAFPQLVTHYKGPEVQYEDSEIEIPGLGDDLDLPELDFN
ncbi:MAG: TRAP transporter large permease subunit [Aquamicrobium sp.]|uniref:TRAP transporter large permease n=1 Tax=Aquamicrobium sp. TaxID=1872579 RepID=UPI00349E8C3B|nr:TRAP transporter large permease subunit [Aquamicrobium sp.]